MPRRPRIIVPGTPLHIIQRGNNRQLLAFLEDLQRSSEDETAMLMDHPAFVRDYQETKEDIRTGNTVRLQVIRRDV